MPKYILYLTGDKNLRYGNHVSEVYCQEITKTQRTKYYDADDNYKLNVRVPVRKLNDIQDLDQLFVKFSNAIYRTDFGQELKEQGQETFDATHYKDGWYILEKEVLAYNRLKKCPSVVKFYGVGRLEFCRAMLLEKGRPVDDDFVQKWCRTETEINKFKNQVRDLLNDIHKRKVLHNNVSLQGLVWFRVQQYYYLKLVGFGYSKCYDEKLGDKDKNEDIKIAMTNIENGLLEIKIPQSPTTMSKVFTKALTVIRRRLESSSISELSSASSSQTKRLNVNGKHTSRF